MRTIGQQVQDHSFTAMQEDLIQQVKQYLCVRGVVLWGHRPLLKNSISDLVPLDDGLRQGSVRMNDCDMLRQQIYQILLMVTQ